MVVPFDRSSLLPRWAAISARSLALASIRIMFIRDCLLLGVCMFAKVAWLAKFAQRLIDQACGRLFDAPIRRRGSDERTSAAATLWKTSPGLLSRCDLLEAAACETLATTCVEGRRVRVVL